MSSSLSPCLLQRFGRCTLRPSSGGWNVELYFAYRDRLFLFPGPCLMDVSYQLSPVNFPSDGSPLPSPDIELTLFGYITYMAQWIKALVRSSDMLEKERKKEELHILPKQERKIFNEKERKKEKWGGKRKERYTYV